MKRPFLSLIVTSVLMVSIFVGILDVSPSVSAEQGPPNDSGLGMDAQAGDNVWTTNGTWTIESGDTVVHSNKTIVVNGDLQINGTLSLYNVTLKMGNATYDGQYNITVYDAGDLLITDLDNDNITSSDASVIQSNTSFRFGFQAIPGAKFQLMNSEVYDCGWSTSPFVDGFGIFINTDWANITGNYITNGYRGVIIWQSDNVTIANNTFDSIEYMGIYTNGAVDCYIRYNTITNVQDYGIYLYDSIYLNVSYNNIFDNPLAYGISLDGGGGHDVFNNLIDNHDIGIFITADGSSYSTSYCYIFGNDISNNTRGIHIQGFDGTSAVRFIYIYDNMIHSNSEYAVFVYGDRGPWAVNNLYLFGNEIYDNIDTFNRHTVVFYSNTFVSDVGIIFCNGNIIRDNSFSSSAGYYMRAVSDVIIWNEQLLRNKRNLWIDSSENVHVINSTLEKSTLPLTLDVQIENKSGQPTSVYFLNTTFNPPYANVEDPGTFLDVKRFLHVRVTRFGAGVDNANVWINDSFGNPDPAVAQPLSTGAGNDGWIRWLEVSEFNRTSTQTTSYTPHHIDARDGSLFGWADPTMDASKEVEISLDTRPIVEDVSILTSSVLRTNQILIVANGSDIEDSEEILIPHFEHKETSGSIWDNSYFGSPTYIGTAPSGYWQVPFIPPKTAALGDHDIRVRFEDTASYFSDWFNATGTVLISNNLPYVEQSNNQSPSVMRGQTIEVWVDGEDIEDGDDQNFSSANAAEIEYKEAGGGIWKAVYLGNEYKDGTDWRVDFTPEASPSKAPLGLYSFRFRYRDNDLDWSSWFENTDWIDVQNSPPAFVDLNPGQLTMFRGGSIWIYANSTDAEDPESAMIVDLYYDEPGGGQVWEQTYLSNLLWDAGGFWKMQFSLPPNAPLGWYDFRIRFTDSDSGYNETIISGLVNVINSPPVPVDIGPSSPTVSAGVGSIFINVNADDLEDAEDLLTIEVEYQLNNSGSWQTAYIGPQSYAGSPPGGYLRVTFQPDSGATLGFYDLRVRIIDTDLATSENPEWIYNYNAVEVLSQIYTVDFITIRDAPNEGGNVVTTMTFGVTDTATFYAAGYNISGGYVDDVDVDWSSDGPSVGSVTSPGPSTLFEARQVAIDSQCNVTATYMGSMTNTTGVLTVLAPTIDGMEIQTAPLGAGTNLADPGNYPTYPVGHLTVFYGALVNDSIGYLKDVPPTATWDSDNTNVVTVTGSGPSSSITVNHKNWALVTITLTDSENGFTKFTQITVLQPTIDYILITDGPSGGGSNLCDPVNYPTFPVGHTTTFYGGYYNSTSGYLEEVPAGSTTWSSDNSSIVSATSSGVSSFIQCSNFNVGTVTITIDDGFGRSNTTQVTVMDVTIDYVVIRSLPGGSGVDLSDPINYPSYPVGYSTTFYAAAYNNTQGHIVDLTVSWFSSDKNVVNVTSPGSSSSIQVSDFLSGTVTITINDGLGHLRSTQVTVLPPTVDYVQIRSDIMGGGAILSNESYAVGSTDSYYGAQYNNTAGYIGDVPFSSSWFSSDDTIVSVNSPSSYTTLAISDTNYGTATITLDDGIGHTNSTQVNVIEPTMDYIAVMDAPSGAGSWVGDSTYSIGQTDTFYVVAFNYTAGYVADVIGQLWTSDRTEVGIVSPTKDIHQVTFTAQIVDEEGVCKITVIYDRFTNSTGTLTVLAPTADFIQIRDAPENSGSVVGDFSFLANVHLPLYAAAFNHTKGYIGDVDAQWESSDVIIGTVENLTTWTFVSQALVDTGSCNVTATYMGLINVTGSLTVYAVEVDYVTIRNNFDGRGSEVTNIILNESESIVLYVAGYNLTSGYVKDIEDVQWDVTGLLGSFTTSGIATTFSAEKSGSGTITITHDFIYNSTEITINDITSPSKPTTPSKEAIGTDEAEISWQASPEDDIKEYLIERSESPSGPWEEVGKVDKDTTSFKDKGLDSGKTYYYRVIAIDEAGNPSDPSAPLKIETAEPTGIFDNFMLILILIIIFVVVIIAAALASRRGKGEPEEIVEDVKFEEMEPIAAAPQRRSRPPPPKRRAQAQKDAEPKPEAPEKEIEKVPVETRPEKSQEPPPPPPPEEPPEGSEDEARAKKKKQPPFPPPPPPPE